LAGSHDPQDRATASRMFGARVLMVYAVELTWERSVLASSSEKDGTYPAE